jgi:hypothetical protein
MNGKMTASTLAALGLLFQAACGAAPESDTGARAESETGDAMDLLSRPYVEDLEETALREKLATMPAEAGGADRLFRGDFLFGGQMLQDTSCNFTLQMGNPPTDPQQTHGGLNTWLEGWGQLPWWGAGTSNPYNYAAFWYATELGGNANFLVFNRHGSTLWETNTWASGGHSVVQQSDANVVMYASGGVVPWANNQINGPYADNCANSNLSGTKTRMRPHRNLNGSDYRRIPEVGQPGATITTLGACGSFCARDANCRSFTFYNGVCWLKNSQPAETNLSNAFSGRKLIGNNAWYE